MHIVISSSEILLRETQAASLYLLDRWKKLCSELDCQFFLEGGSLLGAYRSQGMIPWDDDIDIGILRTDYERLRASISHTGNFLGDPFIVFHEESICHAALRCYLDRERTNHIQMDIFIFDQVSNVSSLNCVLNRWLRALNFLSRRSEDSKNSDWKPHLSRARRAMRKLLNSWNWTTKLKNGLMRFLYLRTLRISSGLSRKKVIAAFSTQVKYCENALQEERFLPFSELNFEGSVFSAPKEPEMYLMQLYGQSFMSPIVFPRHVQDTIFVSPDLRPRYEEYLSSINYSAEGRHEPDAQ